MATRADAARFGHIVKSIEAFRRQRYEPTELVIVCARDAADALDDLIRHVASLADARIRVVVVPGRPTLGVSRNRTIDEARGDIVCQWDDDDLFHPDRVLRQVATIVARGADACLLEDVVQFHVVSRELYWTNWRMTAAGGHPGTLACRRAVMPRYPESGPKASLGEDSAVVEILRATRSVTTLTDEPHLFVYQTHGDNAWPAEHHHMLIEKLAISRSLLTRREARLRAGLAPIDLGDGPITVSGSNGPAFVLDRTGP